MINIDINECASNPCQQASSTCVDQINSYTCNCPPEWTGTNCETGIFKLKLFYLIPAIYKRSMLYIFNCWWLYLIV